MGDLRAAALAQPVAETHAGPAALSVGSRVTEALGAVEALPRIEELGRVLPDRLR